MNMCSGAAGDDTYPALVVNTTPVIVHFVVMTVFSGLVCSYFYYTDILWKSRMALHLS
jgi:hypothetical protein